MTAGAPRSQGFHCTHCHGTGRAYQQPTEGYSVPQGAWKRMIPHGNEVAAALRRGPLQREVYLFCGTCPATGRDQWELASAHIASFGHGTAMVLPDGVDPSSLRYPALDASGSQGFSLVVIAYGMLPKAQHALGHALVHAGMKRVQVIGGLSRNGLYSGPLTFELEAV